LGYRGPDRYKVLQIRDLTFDPRYEVTEDLDVHFTLENSGLTELYNLLITVSIPKLNMEETNTIFQLLPGQDTRQAFKFVFGNCERPGIYDVKIRVESQGMLLAEESQTFRYVNPECDIVLDPGQDKVIITIPEALEVTKGKTISYPITITNLDSAKNSYTIRTKGITFGHYSLEPGSVVLVKPGRTEQAYLHLTIDKNAELGPHFFSVLVGTDGEKEEISVSAIVLDEQDKTTPLYILKLVLEILLVIFVVALIAIGAIIGYKKHAKQTKLVKYY
jgi:uncharacterized membrane protein